MPDDPVPPPSLTPPFLASLAVPAFAFVITLAARATGREAVFWGFIGGLAAAVVAVGWLAGRDEE